MRVQFIGVGEAFDETLPNNSQLLEWQDCRLLIDCGYAVPHSLWKLHPEPEFLDAIYLSHRHADHYFGLPSYIVRLAEDGRSRPLNVFCPQGMKEVILEMIECAYQGIMSHLTFSVVIREVNAGEPVEYHKAYLDFAPSSHPVKNYAVCVSAEGRKYAYSGDGNFNEHTQKLYTGCSLLVHEAYSLDEEVRGHAKIIDLLPMAQKQKVQALALTHLQRDIRKKRRKEIENLIKNSGLKVFIPEVGEIYEV